MTAKKRICWGEATLKGLTSKKGKTIKDIQSKPTNQGPSVDAHEESSIASGIQGGDSELDERLIRVLPVGMCGV